MRLRRRRDTPSRFEMTFFSGEKSYFLSGSSKGLVAGPRLDGKDDHITVGLDGDEFAQVHRTVNGREEWRITPESFQAELDSFLAGKTTALDAKAISPSSYVISLDKVNIVYSAAQKFFSLPLSTFCRLLCQTEVVRSGNTIQYRVSMEPRRLQHVLNQVRLPLRILSPFLKRSMPLLVPGVFKRVAKHFLLSPKEVRNLGEDVAVLISNEQVGFIWQKEDGGFNFISMYAMGELYQRIERNQPFGNLGGPPAKNFGAIRLSARSIFHPN